MEVDLSRFRTLEPEKNMNICIIYNRKKKERITFNTIELNAFLSEIKAKKHLTTKLKKKE